jgi:autotransporter-associated beta strand protein
MRGQIASVGLLIVGLQFVHSPGVNGATDSWILPAGQSGNWSSGSNWSLGVVPNGDALVGNGGTVTIATPYAGCNGLTVGGGTAASTVLVAAGGSLFVNGPVDCQGTISAIPYRSVTLNNGLTLTGNGSVNLGYGTLTVNDLTSGISGGTLSAFGQLIGNKAFAAFSQSGGSSAIGTLVIDSGAYNLSGNAQLSASNEYIGNSSPANFNQIGGTHTVTGSISIGFNGNGTYSAGGSAVLSAGTISVGNGTWLGTFAESSSAAVTAQGFIVNGGSSTLDESARLSAPWIGDAGSFSQSGSSHVVTGTLELGVFNPSDFPKGAPGTYNLSGNAVLSTTSEQIGNLKFGGAFTQSGGTNLIVATTLSYPPYVSGGYLSIDNQTGSNSYTLSGSNSLLSTYQTDVAGAFVQSGGTHSAATSIYIVGNNYGVSYYELSGNALLLTNTLSAGGLGMIQSGGTANIKRTLSFGTYYLENGLLSAGTIAGGGVVNFGGGMLRTTGSFTTSASFNLYASGGNATIDIESPPVKLSGSLTGPGNLIKAGSGTLILSGTNTYGGGTTVANGALIVISPQSLASGTDLAIGNAGAFPAPIVPGDLSPGDLQSLPVPEPGSSFLVAVAAIACIGYVRRRSHPRRSPQASDAPRVGLVVNTVIGYVDNQGTRPVGKCPGRALESSICTAHKEKKASLAS